MADRIYTDTQLSTLRTNLAEQSVALSDHERIVGGNFGDGFISDTTVLKLFRTQPKIPPDNGVEAYFDESVRSYENVRAEAAKMRERGIEAPTLLGHGKLSPPIKVADQEYFAWQRMTRVNGEPMVLHMWKPGAPEDLVNAQCEELVKIAAKTHIPVDPAGKEIKKSPDLQSLKHVGTDAVTSKLVSTLEQDMRRLESSQNSTVLLHCDLQPGNITRKIDGSYGLLDWDGQAYGRPEHDLEGSFALRPQRSKEFCDIYNSIATQPINEQLAVAYATAAYLRHYDHALETNQSPDRQLFLTRSIARLTTRMHELTGTEAYADATRHFSGMENLPQPSSDRRSNASSMSDWKKTHEKYIGMIEGITDDMKDNNKVSKPKAPRNPLTPR